jgi:hypothetical protein
MSQTHRQCELAIQELDIDHLMARLDRMDILLLKRFYVTGRPHPDDTSSYVLRILVDEFQRDHRLGKKAASYHTIRHRLENLRALGLIGKIPMTNPTVYFPLDHIATDIKRLILKFAAELVGVVPMRRKVEM